MPLSQSVVKWSLRAGFAAALGLSILFGARTVLSALYWNDPRHSDQVIEGWMPVGYIGRSWQIPREVLGEALALGPEERGRHSLAQIAERRGVPVAVLATQIMTAIDAFRAQQGQTPGGGSND